jgi:integrase/recombinase XerD
LGGDKIRRFELHLLREKKLAPGTVEARMSALRFLYRKVLKRRDIAYDDLIFPKIPHKLPVVLSPDEVTRMIEAAPNPLHRTILVLYATGMRRTKAPLDGPEHVLQYLARYTHRVAISNHRLLAVDDVHVTFR